MLDWFKRSWANLLILLGLILGSVVVFFTRRRELPTIPPPPAPEPPPVDIPDVNIAPATTYLDTKAQPVDVAKNGVSHVVNSINARHK
jgi:hypothetical protein